MMIGFPAKIRTQYLPNASSSVCHVSHNTWLSFVSKTPKQAVNPPGGLVQHRPRFPDKCVPIKELEETQD